MLVGRLNPLFAAIVALILGVMFGTATAGTAVAQLQPVSTDAGGVLDFTYDAPGDVAPALAGEPAGLERSVAQWASTTTPVGGTYGHIYAVPAEQVAPSVTRGVRGLAGAGDVLAQGGVYALRDPVTGQVVRTGRTNSLTRRAGEHLRDPALADFEFEVIARTDVYAQQRGLEQLAHDAYSPALNRIRPISPSNPALTTYMDAADDFLSVYGGG